MSEESTEKIAPEEVEQSGTNWGLITVVILIIISVIGFVTFLEGSIGMSRFGTREFSYSPGASLMNA